VTTALSMTASNPVEPLRTGDAPLTLTEVAWTAAQAAHQASVDTWLLPHRQRAERGEKHPVMDFLFTYYSFRANWVRRWHPGIGVTLLGAGAQAFLTRSHYSEYDGGVRVDATKLSPQRIDAIRWITQILSLTGERPGFYGCHGLHEWAMVYGSDQQPVRHASVPLRLPGAAIDALVRERGVRCSHFDAFRHFAPAAQPLNRLQLTRDGSPQHEQPGCLHANMDLYKWAFKLTPFTPSDLLADAFRLAVAIREIDMRASPYDLSAFGYAPIQIETEAGRAEYEQHQRDFTARARPIRDRLITVGHAILAAATEDRPGSPLGPPPPAAA